jgi:hypothetical protein
MGIAVEIQASDFGLLTKSGLPAVRSSRAQTLTDKSGLYLRPELADPGNQSFDVGDWRIRQDAMAKVEDERLVGE